ncbi:MAG: methionine--tRNA ligase subunit beta [Solirubrobacterales bacterium]|nr:MAG: methionine--tRNA ligase subunit beta [Solirubrobacterales bacterium]
MRFGLDRMRRLMTALDHPQRRFDSIHVVGTNGKSSTARMIAAILAHHGLRTGAYLSPHLLHYGERIRIDDVDLEPGAFAAAVARAARAAQLVDRSLAGEDRVTQFEALTAAAYSELALRGVQVAVIEAGLGGRYDATNVIPSKVQVLTSVGLEHTRWLGPTLADIDLDLKAFEERVNSHLVGKWVNLASRTAGFVYKHFDGVLVSTLPDAERARYDAAAKKLEACAALYEARDYAAAIRLIVEVADEANAYVADKAPWLLAKDEGKRDELHVVCTLALNYFRLLTIWFSPVVPGIAARALSFLSDASQSFDDARTPLLGVRINAFAPLAQRIDPKNIEAVIEASKDSLQPSVSPQVFATATVPESITDAKQAIRAMNENDANSFASSGPRSPIPSPEIVSIDDFARLDLRIGKVITCEHVEGSDKLLRFELDAGNLGTRQIFSGIKAAYAEPGNLVGRNVVFIANLSPRKMRFGISEGMILSAGSGGDQLFLLDVDAGAQAGMPVK